MLCGVALMVLRDGCIFAENLGCLRVKIWIFLKHMIPEVMTKVMGKTGFAAPSADPGAAAKSSKTSPAAPVPSECCHSTARVSQGQGLHSQPRGT